MQSEASIIKNVYSIVDSIKPESMELTDSEGNPTTDREDARAITFPYFGYGKISISIMNPNNLLVLVSPNIEDLMSEDSKDRYKNFIMKIKKVGDSFPDVKFTINKVTGDDFQKHLTKSQSADLQASKEKELSMNNISEALNPMFGSSRSSYQQLDNIRMIVKHARPVDESIKGSRTRAIKAIYLENSQGERFRLPINNLWAGRAMARHMVNNGTIYDVTGQRILEWAGRIGKLQKFARYAKNNGLVNEGTTDIMNAVTQNISDAKSILQQLSSQNGYASFNGDIPVAPMMRAEDERVARLKETFTVKTFDESLEDTLPLIGALIMEKEKDQSGDIFAGLPEVMNVLKTVIMDKKLDPKVLTSMKANVSNPDAASQLGIKASKVSSEFTGKNDTVSNFMSRMSDILDDYHNRMAFEQEKKDPRFNKALALTQAFVNANDLGAFNEDGMSEIKSNNPMESFNNWANLVIEGVNVSPTSPDQQKKLNELLATPVELGEDGVNSIGSLIGIIEDDSLNGLLSGLAEENSEADARPVIVDWLKTHNLTNILEDETITALANDGMEINEGFAGAALGGVAGAVVGKTPGAAMTGAKLGSMAQDKIEKMMPQQENAESDHMKYDTSDGSPYDRGGADAWYGRKENPHKYVASENGGKRREQLSDPEEIAAYKAGYDEHVKTHGPGGEKDYREDINEAKKAKKKIAEKKTTKSKSKANDKKAKERYTGGMHGTYEPTKKQSSKQKHLDAVKYHEDEAAVYMAAMKSSKADPKDNEWYKKTIQTHKDKAEFHRNAAKSAINEAEEPAQVQAPTSATLDTEVVKILTQIYNVIKEAAPSMPQDVAGHLFNANKEMVAAINAAKTVKESKRSKKKVNEAPVGVGQRLGTWARGKAAGALGPLARGWQAQIAGEKEINTAANKLGVEFRKVLGRQKIDVNNPKAIDILYNWSKRMGYPVDNEELFKDFQAAKSAATRVSIAGSGVAMPGADSGSEEPTGGAAPAAAAAPAPAAAPGKPDWSRAGGGRTEPTFNIPKAAPAAAPEKGVPTPATIDPRAAAQLKPVTNPAIDVSKPDPTWDFKTRREWQKQQDEKELARKTQRAKIDSGARARSMKYNTEDVVTEDKKAIDDLIYKMVLKHDELGGAGAAASTSTPSTTSGAPTDPNAVAQAISNMSGKDISALAQALKSMNIKVT